MSGLIRISSVTFDELGLEILFEDNLKDGEQLDAEPSLTALGQTPFAKDYLETSDTWSEASVEKPVSFDGEVFPSGLVLRRASGATGYGEEHWDPHATGLPLLATGPSTHAERLSPHFMVKELVNSGGRASSVSRISPTLVRVLEGIRERAGKPVRIISGYRSWAHNKQAYAAQGESPTPSRHCSGQAADIKIAGMTGVQIAKLAIDAAGMDLGIGVGPNYIHVDVRGTWTLWSYIGGIAGKTAIAEIQLHRDRVFRSGTPIFRIAEELQYVLRSRRLGKMLDREELAAATVLGWVELTLSNDNFVVEDLKAQSGSSANRLKLIGNRVGLPAHSKSAALFSMSEDLSILLRTIESAVITPSTVTILYLPGPVGEASRRVITEWSAATGKDLKARVKPVEVSRPRLVSVQ